MFRNDIGTVLEFTCYDQDDNILDLTTATAAYLYIKRGDEVLKWTAVIDDDPTSGIVRYTVVDGDLSEGDFNYQLQVTIDFVDGSHYNGKILEEHVARPLEVDYVEPIP